MLEALQATNRSSSPHFDCTFESHFAMDETTTSELHELFAPPPSTKLPPDILGEIQSIVRLHSISAQELFYKWESYSIKMGSEETKLDLETVRAFKTDVQESLERGLQSKSHLRSTEKRGHAPGSASRIISSSGDVMNMFVLTGNSMIIRRILLMSMPGLTGLYPLRPDQEPRMGQAGTQESERQEQTATAKHDLTGRPQHQDLESLICHTDSRERRKAMLRESSALATII
jgi:hypothetical protein